MENMQLQSREACEVASCTDLSAESASDQQLLSSCNLTVYKEVRVALGIVFYRESDPPSSLTFQDRHTYYSYR